MDQQDDDEREEGVRRARDHGASLPPVKRDGVVEVGRARFSVYSGQGAVEMRRREAESKRLREGGRRSSWS